MTSGGTRDTEDGVVEHDERKGTMAQGEFTKEEAELMTKLVTELFEAIAKSKRTGFIGHLNDILLFIDAAKEAAPADTEGR